MENFLIDLNYYYNDTAFGLDLAMYCAMYPWINSNFIAIVSRCIKEADINTFQSF